MSPVARLIRLAGELGAAAVEGVPPNPVHLAKQLASLGNEAVGADMMRQFLSDDEAARVNAKLDAEMRGGG